MRQLRFRIWDEFNKKMCVSASMKEYMEKDAVKIPEGEEKFIMQFTGLLDKNGTDIYEGDILATPTHENMEVIWDTERGAWMLDEVGHPTGQLSHFAQESEVVGNIYQHKNLL